MKKYWMVLMLATVGLQPMAQETSTALKDLTLKDAVIGRWTYLAPENMSQLHWIPKSDYYSFVKDDELLKASAKGGSNKSIISLEELSKNAGLELKRFPRVTWLNNNQFYFGAKGVLYSYDLKEKKADKIATLDPKTASMDLDPTTLALAFTKENNLFIDKNGKTTQVTKDGREGIVNGEAVHRFEFGISKGTFWSPKGDKLAFYKKDETMVTDYPLSNFEPRPAELNSIKYPMAGMESHQVKLGVYDLNSEKTIFLKITGSGDQYLTNIAWHPSGSHLYVALINRDQNHVTLNQYSAADGSFVKTILEESNDTYIEPTQAMTFVDGGFIWQSAKNGLDQFYYYPDKGTPRLIQTNDVITHDILHYNKSNDKLLFTGNYKNEIENHLFSVSIKSNKNVLKQITPSGSDHSSIQVSSNGKYTLDKYSNLELANGIDVVTNSNSKRRNLLSADNPFEGYKVAQTELVELETENNTKLFARIIKPHDFDPSKKYPVLQYVYNGPNVQLIRNNWLASASLWMHYFANKGYIVFTVDGRGSANRGMEFEQATFRQLGQEEMKDQVKGAEYLKSLPYVDGNRLAIHGWSYGGFMTVSLMLNYPELYNVGVAGGPVIDWSLYEIMYTERYMDTPETNEKGYELTSTLNKVKDLDGKLMLIHGADDDVVVMQHSMKFLKACIDNEKQVDFFVYPGHKHNVRGKDRVHLMEKVLNYIEENIDKK